MEYIHEKALPESEEQDTFDRQKLEERLCIGKFFV